MVTPNDSKRSSMDKVGVEVEESVPVRDPLIEQYELIRDKTPEELKALDKAVVSKLD
ncbi:major facilitator superfamily transporter [Colletotrichum graminicola]|nr:major facilitator superfamily transporter [Colletotrichum graminicola]